MLKRLLAVLLSLASPAWAQTLNVFPTTLTANSTIAVTNTFQVALAAPSGPRVGCAVQNQGTHVMYVFFGASASATTAKSFQLQAGQIIYCEAPPIILQDIVNITGTAGDAYVVTSQ